MQKDHAKGYLSFTKKEKRGVMSVLATVILIFISSKYIYPFVVKDKAIPANEIAAASAMLKEKGVQQKSSYRENYPEYKSHYSNYQKETYSSSFTGEMFYFDPNTLDAAGWKKLGIKDKTAATILNYISKGGKFREPDDLRKIWGLRDDEKNRLVPYVRIAAELHEPAYSNAYKSSERKAYEKKIPEAVDINSGDSAAFDALPGIGPGYAKRIISFRNRLGGFYKADQVAETFGLPDSVFQRIKPFLKISGNDVRKININTATGDELKAHPYIRWQLANVIMEYKKQHGNFQSLADLKKIMTIDAETYNKIIPYLEL